MLAAAAEVIRRHARVQPDRLRLRAGQTAMRAVVTTGHGGLERLELRDVPRPDAGPGEVLIRVLAAGVNNTDLNTRLGWYATATTSGTATAWEDQEQGGVPTLDGGWNGATPFPLIQGVDCCGEVVATGLGVDAQLVGCRVLVRPNMRPDGFASLENLWMGCDFDGSFAEFVTAPASEAFPVRSAWSDAELGSMPCAYGTAENMVMRARVRAGEHVVVVGASGGVGSAAVQLASRRGARVTAIAGLAKASALRALGADDVVDRGPDAIAMLGSRVADVVLDSVGGPGLRAVIDLLRPGGRYAACGAIAGPIVELDLRTVYLRDLTLIGCTAWEEPVFPSLIDAIERDQIRSVIAGTYPLGEIAAAQTAFMAKQHVGKYVLLPSQTDHGAPSEALD